MKKIFALLALACAATAARAQAPKVSDSDVVEAYEYMIGRWLVLRQEARDFKDGMTWNVIAHREPGGVARPNPDLDVVSSEAWIAVDDSSCALLTLPEIKGRYYTVQIVNGWGEVIDNINERTYPTHPSGAFALCLTKAKVNLPAAAQRVEVAGKTSRILIRIELGADPAQALALQKQITMQATGAPQIDEPVWKPDFSNDTLPGVEAFDRTDAILASEADINKGMAEPQAKARAVAAAAADPAQRAHIDDVIRNQAIPDFVAAIPKKSLAVNGWVHPRITGNYGNDYLMRSVVDYIDIWANTPREAVDFGNIGLDGGQTYTQTFDKDELPARKSRYFWSVLAVDGVNFRVIPNPLDRYFLNDRSDLKLNPDGSLTLVYGPKLPDGVPQSNWLPTPDGRSYNLTFRYYGPARDIVQGRYYPPLLSIKGQ